MKSKEEVLKSFHNHCKVGDCESCSYHTEPKYACVDLLIHDMLTLMHQKEIDPLKLFKEEGESDAEQEH